MVYVIGTFEVAPGKMTEALELLRRSASNLKKISGVEPQRMRAVTPPPGETGKIISITTHESLAAWGEYQQKVMADPERNAISREGFVEKQVFVSYTRTLYSTI